MDDSVDYKRLFRIAAVRPHAWATAQGLKFRCLAVDRSSSLFMAAFPTISISSSGEMIWFVNNGVPNYTLECFEIPSLRLIRKWKMPEVRIVVTYDPVGDCFLVHCGSEVILYSPRQESPLGKWACDARFRCPIKLLHCTTFYIPNDAGDLVEVTVKENDRVSERIVHSVSTLSDTEPCGCAFVIDNNQVFCSFNGVVYLLSARTKEVIWENPSCLQMFNDQLMLFSERWIVLCSSQGPSCLDRRTGQRMSSLESAAFTSKMCWEEEGRSFVLYNYSNRIVGCTIDECGKITREWRRRKTCFSGDIVPNVSPTNGLQMISHNRDLALLRDWTLRTRIRLPLGTTLRGVWDPLMRFYLHVHPQVIFFITPSAEAIPTVSRNTRMETSELVFGEDGEVVVVREGVIHPWPTFRGGQWSPLIV